MYIHRVQYMHYCKVWLLEEKKSRRREREEEGKEGV